MTTNTNSTISRARLDDGCCPFCSESRSAQIEMDAIEVEEEIYQNQRCKTCGREWRLFYGPVGVVHNDAYLPAVDDPTWRAMEREVRS